MKKNFNTYLFLLQDNIQNLRSYYLGVRSRNAITLFFKKTFYGNLCICKSITLAIKKQEHFKFQDFQYKVHCRASWWQ